tara:strand:+ start:187 stop:687 length:501 start_codon:yes stop_codon:yes gene_type:complete
MATFNATAIKHPSSSTNNIVLNSDGTIAATSTSGTTDSPACVTAQSSSSTEARFNAVQIVSVTIDPVRSTSRILITAGGPFRGGEDTANNEIKLCEVQLQRNGNNIATKTIGFFDGGGFYIAHLDTTNHSGNQVTYRINLQPGDGDGTSEYIYANPGCSICALEIF